MKLTDIDLSSPAEVSDAILLLESVYTRMASEGAPLPTIEPDLRCDRDFVVNPAPELPRAEPAPGSSPNWSRPGAMERALATGDAVKMEGLGIGTIGEVVTSMDAASVFGGAPAQSATPLPLPAPSTAGAAPSPTVPAAPLGSGPTSQASSALPALAPLPGASAAAPTAPAAPASPAGGVELDTDGLPWDARIHAGTKRRNADGRWTSKKGINDPDLVPRVVAQLRAQMAAGGVHASADGLRIVSATLPPAPPGSLGAALGVPQMTLGQLQEAQMQSAAAAPVSTLAALQAAMTPTSAAPAPTTFQDFMTALTVEVQAGRVPIEALGAACQPLGGVSALNSKPELIPVAWASLKAKYPGML